MESTQSPPRYLQTHLSRTSPSTATRLDPAARTVTSGSGVSITDTALPSSSPIKAGQPFLTIDTDILLLIVNYLDIRDVIALRQICRSLSQRCSDHSVWSSVVMTNIISKKLPWPSYALPLSEVPAATLERLCVRAVQIETKRDAERLRQDLELSRCIQRPWNSITWMGMLRSRWILVQLDKGRLELWDIDRPFTSPPVSYFDGLDAIVDGHKFSHTSNESSTLVLSTRAHKTYHIRIELPQMGVAATQAPQFDLLKTVAGCSGLLDIDEDLALFSRSTSDDGAIVQCQRSAATITLRSERGEPKLDYAVCAKVAIHIHVVAIVRRPAIEFYSLDAIHRALKSSGQLANGLDEVLPTQSIPFPGDECGLRATFLNRPLHCEKLPSHGTDAIYLGIDRDQEASETIRVVYRDTSDGAEGCSFAVSRPFSPLAIMPFFGADSTVLCAWGETGRRMVQVVDFRELRVGGFHDLRIHVTGFCTPTGFGNERFVFGAHAREVFRWTIPDSRRDVARYLAFDEVTGVCAFAMGSGRIWIADPFCNGVGPKDQDVPLEKVQFWNSPDPDPAWRFIPRKPWYGEPNFPYVLGDSRLPPMTTEVCRWFPGKNNPEAFGSVKWFVNEVLHIPGPATVLLVGKPRYRPHGSFDIVCLGGRLLLIDRDAEMPSYDIKVLDTNITLESVVAHIKAEGLLANLPGKTVAVDAFSLNGYDAWRERWEKRSRDAFPMW